jgi:hypothetical protein
MYAENTTTKGLGNQELYGHGFAYAHRLPDDPRVDRSNIEQRIKAKEFDLIVYGDAYRGTPMLDVVTVSYSPSQVAFIDGDDWQDWSGVSRRSELLNKGTYFLREMPDGCPAL